MGVVWLLLLPLEEYSRNTYISENALLPGGVHTYFTGSEQNVFRAYRHEVQAIGWRNATTEQMIELVGGIFRGQGLKVGTQKFRYEAGGDVYEGENVYAVLEAPRGDATEAVVLAAPWINGEDRLNESGVALVLALARYFKRWSPPLSLYSAEVLKWRLRLVAVVQGCHLPDHVGCSRRSPGLGGRLPRHAHPTRRRESPADLGRDPGRGGG